MRLTAAIVASAITSLSVLAFSGTQRPGGDQHPDAGEIVRAALDYGEGWYEGEGERMKRALHPELAKRMVYTDAGSGRSRLHQQSAMTLVDNTVAGGGSRSPVADEPSVATILDVYGNAAVVKVQGPEWVDYLQMAKWNGRWVIVNVLWERHPDGRGAGLR